MPPVTNDWQVTRALAPAKKALTALEVAQALGLTPFQITARLKGMELRRLVEREKGLWKLTEDGRRLSLGPEPPPPPPRRERQPGAGGGAVPLPQDDGVKRLHSTSGWTLRYVWFGHTRIDIYTDRKGQQWVVCNAMETATVIRVFKNGLTPVRLRPLSGSSRERQIMKIERERETIRARAEAKGYGATTSE